ncbi:MAG TPA: hypothetical protein PKV57_01780 [Bacilli bacterium]|jgi:hypothetical protein|nr:hypothetical protein [Bacilli bacterium]
MPFKILETDNYIFHYLEGSLAEKDILIIAQEQEKAFCQICNFLKMRPSFKIKYYLYDSADEVGKIYGDNEPCNGFANPDDKSVCAVYNEDVKCIGPHEDAHVLSFSMNDNFPRSEFLIEGFAMFFDEMWWSIENNLWVKYYIYKGRYISIKELLKDDKFYSIDCSITYPIGGSFTNYLINNFGLEKYLTLFSSKDSNIKDTIKTIYEISLEEIEQKFLNYLDSLILSNELSTKMTKLINKYSQSRLLNK